MIFVLLLSAVVNVLVYLQGYISKKNVAQMSYAIAVDDSSWARLSTFKGVIVGNAFFCFTLASPFAYPLKVCSNKNGNDPYASLLESFLKSALKD